jgi:hypothetical protein
MAAVVDYGSPLLFPSVSAPIREDGASTFTSTMSLTESGVTLAVDAIFNVTSARLGELTGTVAEVWRVPNISGEGRISQDIVATTRTSITPSGLSDRMARRLRLLQKRALQER